MYVYCCACLHGVFTLSFVCTVVLSFLSRLYCRACLQGVGDIIAADDSYFGEQGEMESQFDVRNLSLGGG